MIAKGPDLLQNKVRKLPNNPGGNRLCLFVLLLCLLSPSAAAQDLISNPNKFLFTSTNFHEDPASATCPDFEFPIAFTTTEINNGVGLSPEIENPNKFKWGSATLQSMFFMGIMHGLRMTEGKTRAELGGPFFQDYFGSIQGIAGWDDGGKVFTNYVAHPAEGAVFGHIFLNNNTSYKNIYFGANKPYIHSRLKALAWSALWSTMFEIGPISEASLGNVGLSLGRQGAIDFVITPTVGMALVVFEDALDRNLVEWIEQKTKNKVLRAISRSVLNPTRSFSNLMGIKKPWYRASRP